MCRRREGVPINKTKKQVRHLSWDWFPEEIEMVDRFVYISKMALVAVGISYGLRSVGGSR